LALKANCLVVFEANNLKQINYFANNLILKLAAEERKNLLLGFNFFLYSPSNNLTNEVNDLLIPFFAVKSMAKEESSLLGI
jgi:hypothetical protein